nr:MAG TPA: hypothetical protein [Bacteriophage sp.]
MFNFFSSYRINMSSITIILGHYKSIKKISKEIIVR